MALAKCRLSRYLAAVASVLAYSLTPAFHTNVYIEPIDHLPEAIAVNSQSCSGFDPVASRRFQSVFNQQFLPEPQIGQRSLGDGMANLPVIAASLPLGQIGVDFDIPQSNIVGLQVDFGNQKSNRYAWGNRWIFRICEPIYGSQNAKLSDAYPREAVNRPEAVRSREFLPGVNTKPGTASSTCNALAFRWSR